MLELYRILNSSFGNNNTVTYRGKLRGCIFLSFFLPKNNRKLISFGTSTFFFSQRNSFFSQLFTVNNLSCYGRGLGQLQEINVIKLTHIYGHSFITSLQQKLWKSFYAMYSTLTVVDIQYRFGMCNYSIFGELRFGPYLKISQNSREDI